jgi:riboflavin synthase alpha subunit
MFSGIVAEVGTVAEVTDRVIRIRSQRAIAHAKP